MTADGEAEQPECLRTCLGQDQPQRIMSKTWFRSVFRSFLSPKPWLGLVLETIFGPKTRLGPVLLSLYGPLDLRRGKDKQMWNLK